jgi:hypothetical protein
MLLVACSTAPETELLTSRISPELKPLVDEFVSDCKRFVDNESCSPQITLTVQFKELKENNLGVCYLYDYPYNHVRRIEINEKIKATPELLKVVMVHELLHCVLQIEHFDKQLDIMNSYGNLETSKYLLSHWDFYLDLVFRRYKDER